MNVLFTILTVFVVIASVLVTIVVLLQNSKGGGLASNFVAGNQTFGVRKTADILEKITWGLVAFIFVFSIVTTFTTTGSGKNEIDITDKVENAATEQVPEFPSAPVQQAAPAQEAPASEAAPAE
ncbi:MAG: preprotein translocase subunit SecG [Bacteroidetes bacterium]|uniref:Protein-export membrane protein SecG n=1 Tax=Candidatus Cryptobacteroides faecavium TaxID=2840762 RepID=A0A9D9ID79_9BACT|nr:preprotein translocase subunit SecG [Candidatus Cryptobacteroides faecavium]